MSKLNVKTTAAIYDGYDKCDYASYHATQRWVSIESLVKHLKDNRPESYRHQSDVRTGQNIAIDDLLKILCVDSTKLTVNGKLVGNGGKE